MIGAIDVLRLYERRISLVTVTERQISQACLAKSCFLDIDGGGPFRTPFVLDLLESDLAQSLDPLHAFEQ